MGVLALWESSKQRFAILGSVHMRTSVLGGNNAVWMSSQTKLSNVRNNLGSSLSWLRFENPDVPNHKSVAPDRAHPGQNESRCLKKCSPLTLATLSTAGNSK